MNYLPYYLSHIGPDHLLLIIYFYFFWINVDDWLLMKMIRLIIILEDLFKPSACKHSHPPFSNQILTHQKFYFDIYFSLKTAENSFWLNLRPKITTCVFILRPWFCMRCLSIQTWWSHAFKSRGVPVKNRPRPQYLFFSYRVLYNNQNLTFSTARVSRF